jgi:8-hydroxy-5-deazaflavin:NADPH oxidoreductase
MKICIIGAGNVGSALGTNWRNKGRDVRFVPNPDDPRYAQLAGTPLAPPWTPPGKPR